MSEETFKKACPTFDDSKDNQIYVTVESARRAAQEVITKHSKPYKCELQHQREQLLNEIVTTYIPTALPTPQEQKILSLTDGLEVYCLRDGNQREYHSIWDLPNAIKPVNNPIEISLTHALALSELDRRELEIKTNDERMIDRLFTELIYLRDKKSIESVLPEIVPLLEFRPYIYDTDYWKSVLSEKE